MAMDITLFQDAAYSWAKRCFQSPDALAPAQRAFRFGEEAIELLQAAGTPRADVLRLVDYVYDRPTGSPYQEVGGTLITLALLCCALELDMELCADTELARCHDRLEAIRAKDLAKPAASPLSLQPVASPVCWSHRRLLALIVSPWLALAAWGIWRAMHHG